MKDFQNLILSLLQLFTFIWITKSTNTGFNRTKLFSLEYNEYCDPEVHAMILNPTKLTADNFETKLEKLDRLIEVSPVLRLCNIHRYLNCSEKTYKCDCWRNSKTIQMAYDPSYGECRGLRSTVCEEDSFVIPFYPDQERPKIGDLCKILDVDLKLKCIQNAECKIGPQYIRNSDERDGKHCVCKTDVFGQYCDHPMSNFTKILQVPQNWESSICESDVSKAFDYVNQNMLYLEQIMVLKFHQAKCNKVLEDKLDEIIEFWQNCSYDWASSYSLNLIRNKEDLNEFKIVGNIAKEILEFKSEYKFGLCNRFLGLCCDERKGICKCPKGSTLQEGRCKRLAGHKCDVLELPWNLPCVKYATCLPKNDEELEGICTCDAGESTPVCRRIAKPKPYLESPTSSNRKRIMRTSTIKPKLPISPAPEVMSEDEELNNPQDEFLHTKSVFKENPRFPDKNTNPPILSKAEEGDLRQLKKLLVEIIYQRTLPLKRACVLSMEPKKFYDIANEVSEFVKNNIPMGIPISEALKTITEIFKAEQLYCNPLKFLNCSESGECACDDDLELNEGKCRISLNGECSTTPTDLKRRKLEEEFILPVPRCRSGTACNPNPEISGKEICMLEEIKNGKSLITPNALQFTLCTILSVLYLYKL